MKQKIVSLKNGLILLLLTITVFVAHEFSTPLENIAMTGSPVGWISLFAYYFVWLFAVFVAANFVIRKVEGG